VIWDVEGDIKVSCGKGKFTFRKRAAMVRQRIMKVKITQNKMRVGKKRNRTGVGSKFEKYR